MNLVAVHILRGAQLLLAIIILGLGADACAQYADGYAPQSAFIVFASVWTILVVLYQMLAPRFMASAAHPWIRLGVDALTMLFWFAGFIALAVLASDWKSYWGFEGDLNGYYPGWNHFYQVTAAAAGLGAIEWILFVVATVFNALDAFKGGNHAPKNNHIANPEVQV